MPKINYSGLMVAIMALNIPIQAKRNKITWQQSVDAVSARCQEVEDSAAKNLEKATKELASQMENMQARLSKEIESIAAQVQDIQDNVNALTEKENKDSKA